MFVDIAVLTVPIYDMQLFDRVLLSRNMSTVAMLSICCGAGLLLYAILDYLRAAAFVAIAERVGHALGVPVLQAGVRRSLGGDQAAGGEAARDLAELRSFLASGAVAVPLDALVSPMLFAVLFLLHPAFGWLAMAGVSMLVMAGIVTDVLVRPAVVAAAQQRSQAANQLAAGLRETDLTEGLGMLPAIAQRWAARHGAALEQIRAAGSHSDHIGAVAKIIRLGLQAGVMALGAVLILSTQASPGALMGANLLLGKVMGPFDALVASWRRWIAAGAAWQRVVKLLATDDATLPADAAAAPGEQGVVLQGVCLSDRASGRRLLQDITLDLPPGIAVALVGQNGAGKSTLLRLMVGLVAPSAGSIRLDGVALAEADRSLIGYLPQGVHLLDGTVWDNVARFQDAPPAKIITAATVAGVHAIVGRLRQGYGTLIGPGALSLSGGQKQRIGLARAVFGAPRLIGLDEPDASLDGLGEEALLQAIQTARAGGAVVVVATHRPKLLAAMDLIITVADGRIEKMQAPPGIAVRATRRCNRPRPERRKPNHEHGIIRSRRHRCRC